MSAPTTSARAFSPLMEDGTPRVFIGVHRPPMSRPTGGLLICTCGATLYTMTAYGAHWNGGCFDTPMYADPPGEARASRSGAEGARTQSDPGDECSCGGC